MQHVGTTFAAAVSMTMMATAERSSVTAATGAHAFAEKHWIDVCHEFGYGN